MEEVAIIKYHVNVEFHIEGKSPLLARLLPVIWLQKRVCAFKSQGKLW